MLQTLRRPRRVTHPASEVLVPFALGASDPVTAAHVASCPTCRSLVSELRQTSGSLRGSALFERRVETPDCPDELVIADFVGGRLERDARAGMIAHLLTCARCRAVVKATATTVASVPVSGVAPRRRWQPWAVPVGVAAAAALVLLLLPRGDDSAPNLREPPLTSTVAPAPLYPRAAVPDVQQFIWSSVPLVQRYRVRLYDDQGSVLWQSETSDTVIALPADIALSPGDSYFWRVEGETEWRRWAASDLVPFRITAP